jgi:archaellum biogenesis protein FlaJ (TadC family)
MRKRLSGIDGREILSAFVKIAIASAVMSAFCYFSYQFLLQKLGFETLIFRIIEAFVPIALGGIVFILMAKILHIDEINKIYNAFARKLKQKNG